MAPWASAPIGADTEHRRTTGGPAARRALLLLVSGRAGLILLLGMVVLERGSQLSKLGVERREPRIRGLAHDRVVRDRDRPAA